MRGLCTCRKEKISNIIARDARDKEDLPRGNFEFQDLSDSVWIFKKVA